MTTERRRLTDHDIERFLRARGKDPDPALWSDVMAAAGSTAQRAGGWARWSARRHVFAIVVTALLVVVMASAIGIGVGLIRPVPPAPSPTVDRSLTSDALNFDRPFSYAIPTDSGLVLDRASPAVYLFEGVDRGVRVIAIRPGTGTFSCGTGRGGASTVITGTAPEILNNLRVIGGVGIAAESRGTLDAREALIADIDPRRHSCEHPELLVPGTQAFIGHVSLDMPARLVLADVEGLIVAVQIWTTRPDDLEAWIPTATEFVETIHFHGEVADFAVPFTYAISSDSELRLEMTSTAQYRFGALGPGRVAVDRGVVVFAVRSAAQFHACEVRSDITGSSEEVFEKLHGLSRWVGSRTPTTLASYPALVADIDSSTSTCGFDIHVVKGPSIPPNYVPFEGRSRLILADVQGIVVGVQIWAEEPDELDAWLPTAMDFVESIEFSGD
jgi:hypothetical protein